MTEASIIFMATKLHIFIVLVAVCLFITVSKQQQKELLVLSTIALPLSFLTSRLLSLVIVNPRPFVVSDIQPLFAHAANNGFPSDHMLLVSTIAFITFTINRSVGVGLIVLSVLVGSSRVIAGVHHTLDIVGSLAISLGAVLVAHALVSRYG